MTDEQDRAEATDADVVDDVDDYSGDEDLADFPPDRPLGVKTVGVTPVEEDAGESFAERTSRQVPEDAAPDDIAAVGQLVDPDASTLDDEEELLGEEQPGVGLSAEEAAMHIEPDR
jgi:hypothetical protein